METKLRIKMYDDSGRKAFDRVLELGTSFTPNEADGLCRWLCAQVEAVVLRGDRRPRTYVMPGGEDLIV